MASRVGKYLLFETLGEGAFGKVKLGVHEETGEQVAVKIMDKSDIKAQEMTMNVRREIAIMKALKHRNIVNLRQVLTSHTKLYIVMDLVTGGELFTKILDYGKLEENVARRYFQQLVDGIDYCHKRGVCHRDLKPENLLIDEATGELKITDFGLSAMKGASTTEELLHTQCGSPNYCAPEIIARSKQGYSGTKVDAWSCGIILFALLAGYLPFYDESTKVLYNMIRYNDVKFPRKFPPEARDLVLCLLHKDPEKRFTLAHVKKHSWFGVGYVGDDAPPRSNGTGSSPPVKSRRKHRRNRSVDQGPRSRDSNGKKTSGRSDGDSGPVSATGIPTATSDGHSFPPLPPVVDVPPRIPMTHRTPAQKPPVPKPGAPNPVAPPPPPSPPRIISSNIPPQYNMHIKASSDPVTELPKVTRAPVVGAEHAIPPYPTEQSGRAVQSEIYASPLAVDRSTRNDNVTARTDGVSGITDQARTPAPVVAGMDLPPRPPPFPAPVAQKGAADETRRTISSQPMENDIPNRDVEIDSRFPPPPQLEPDVPESNQVQTMDTVKLPVGGERNENARTESSAPSEKSRWNVVLTPPPAPTFGSTMAPVTTPAAFADGDASWVKNARNSKRDESDPTPPTAPAPRMIGQLDKSGVAPKFGREIEAGTAGQEASLAMQYGESEESMTSPKNEEKAQDDSFGAPKKPLSIVEQRRLMYNKLAEESAVSPPIPDVSFRAPQMEPARVPADAALSAGQRFGDRAERPVVTGYPTLNGTGDVRDDGNGPEVRGRLVAGTTLEDSLSTRTKVNDRREVRSVEVATVTQEGASPTPRLSAAGKAEGSTAETATNAYGNTGTQVKSDVFNVPGLADEEEAEVSLKERLTAALARYRRIFKLGNKIGITSSPSFTSNRGTGPGDSSGDEDSSKIQSSSRSNFFARAKTITGAWGIILTQELEEDSDSEDDTPQVTEDELQAFSRLLDFWDNRRASASVPSGGEVLLDDENSSPLSEADILSIQSLLQKLEPKEVEDEMSEVVDDVSMTAYVPTHGTGENTVTQSSDDLEDLAIQDVRGSLPERLSTPPTAQDPIPSIGNTHKAAIVEPANQSSATAPPQPPPLPPPPPPFAVRRPIPDHAASQAHKDVVREGVSWDRGAGTTGAQVTPVPPPPAPLPPVTPSAFPTGTPHIRSPPPPPPPPPPYPAAKTVPEPDNVRPLVTPVIARDPFRPRPPPAYPPPQPPSNRPGSSTRDSEDSSSKASVGKSIDSHHKHGGRLPGRASRDARRTSSTAASDADADGRRKTSRDSGRGSSGRGYSTASGPSRGSEGLPKRGHVRTPTRDDTATRGLFAFGMFGRRRSSAMNSFESDLAPDRCLLEVGRILTGMGCNVMVKQGESKMKCVAPLKQEKLFISITCTQEKKVSTVHFRRGRKDRSHVDAREFYDFFQVVHSRFQDRVQPDSSL